MGWLERKFLDWATAKQIKELEKWLGMLRAMNSDEVGALVAVATHLRHELERRFGMNVLDPVLAYKADTSLAIKLNSIIKDFQSAGQPTDAAGIMVWLFTVRCAAALELRQLGRDLWRELRRGFPHVEAKTDDLLLATGKILNIEGYEQIPIGLEPERT